MAWRIEVNCELCSTQDVGKKKRKENKEREKEDGKEIGVRRLKR